MYYTSSTVPGEASPSSIFILNAAASGTLACYGLWVIVFGADTRISSLSGKDKRVSGWPFSNAQSEGMKEERRERKAKGI